MKAFDTATTSSFFTSLAGIFDQVKKSGSDFIHQTNWVANEINASKDFIELKNTFLDVLDL